MFGWTHKWSGGEGQSENSYKNEDSICTVQEKSEVVECRDIVARLVGQDKNNDVGHNTRDMGVRLYLRTHTKIRTVDSARTKKLKRVKVWCSFCGYLMVWYWLWSIDQLTMVCTTLG